MSLTGWVLLAMAACSPDVFRTGDAGRSLGKGGEGGGDRPLLFGCDRPLVFVSGHSTGGRLRRTRAPSVWFHRVRPDFCGHGSPFVSRVLEFLAGRPLIVTAIERQPKLAEVQIANIV